MPDLFESELFQERSSRASQGLGDLSLGSMNHDSVVFSMPIEMRVVMSTPGMEALIAKQKAWLSGKMSRKGFSDLQAEVGKGTCDLSISAAGAVCRVVPVVTLMLERSGLILVRIGKFKNGVANSAVGLPGTKLRAGQFTREGVQQFVEEQLPRLVGMYHIIGHEVETEEKLSDAYHMLTRYHRNIYHAVLIDPDGDACTSCPPISPSNKEDIFRVTSFENKKKFTLLDEGPPELFVTKDGADTHTVYAWLSKGVYEELAAGATRHAGLVLNWLSTVDLATGRPNKAQSNLTTPSSVTGSDVGMGECLACGGVGCSVCRRPPIN